MDGLINNVITQVAIVVRDIEKTACNYAELFGMEMPPIILTDPEEKAHTRYQGQPTSARAKLAFFRMGSLSLELIEPIGGPSTWQEFLDKHGEGIHHIAFQVQDMDKAVRFLESKGISLVQQGDFTGGCYAYMDATPQLGAIIELLVHDHS
ncbi:MAG: VOC family protein [Anaerolineae bacterium]|nr:VOC family protein [Anaerolineae bacterium]MDW8099431.1 VOC family protein [Anaerolineae bacterium]